MINIGGEMGTEYIEHCITWITGVNQNKFGRKRRHMRFNLSRYYSLVNLRKRLKICNWLIRSDKRLQK